MADFEKPKNPKTESDYAQADKSMVEKLKKERKDRK